ncbi:MAG: MBL fold metallo-hydrolase [Candidatus Thermoplasmatota archaeon]|nr:MBL fold metallo-hydrolase [Candidatus Thermoplasmatota archaeon]
MLQLHVLGTSSARFAHGRSVSGSVIDTPGGLALIDCGEGMQQRILNHNRTLKASGANRRTRLARVRCILLTHGHLDHSWGVLPLLQTLSLDGRRDPLTIIGPSSQAAIDWVTQHPGEVPPKDSGISSSDLAILFMQWQLLGSRDEELNYPIDWVLIPIEDESPISAPVQPLEGVNITVVPTHHGVPSCGYHIATLDRGGRFDRERVKSLGLTPTQVSALAAGEDIEVGDSVLHASEFRGTPRPGRSIMVSGDTAFGPIGFTREMLPSAPDLLLHEATFLSDKQDKATEYLHSTAADAGRHATSCHAGALALTHYSSRLERLSPSVSEAREHFSGPVIATCDGDRFEIDLDGKITHHHRLEDGWNSVSL